MLVRLENLFQSVVLAALSLNALAFTKVVVPAVYKDWQNGSPDWATNLELQKKYNFTVFTYQKLDPNASNYFEHNRGTETGVYLKYVVDHYDNFPDVAIFIHATPQRHQPNWLNMVGCISPNATWYHMNYGYEAWIARGPEFWKDDAPVQEQCWRDVLQIIWELKDNKDELLRRLPPTQPLTMRGPCCNQFLVSRAMIHKRPLHVWKELLQIIAMQPTCHVGDLDYDNLYESHIAGRVLEREKPFYEKFNERVHSQKGSYVQGHAGEHLNHVIFGHQELQMKPLTQEEICQNFIRGCPGSPCDALPSHKSSPPDSVSQSPSEIRKAAVSKSRAAGGSSRSPGRGRQHAAAAPSSSVVTNRSARKPVLIPQDSVGNYTSEHKPVVISQNIARVRSERNVSQSKAGKRTGAGRERQQVIVAEGRVGNNTIERKPVMLSQNNVVRVKSERKQGEVFRSSAGKSTSAGRERKPVPVAHDSAGNNTSEHKPVALPQYSAAAGRIRSERKEAFVSESSAGRSKNRRERNQDLLHRAQRKASPRA